ncbi:uncharacterized protein J8A68_000954 [[Candida] subhashii]|uniref:Histone demethylase JHD2 n=1 Tax=[Candida] subhashii TaxID=561895 RepID=A0A8J5UT50_9ASCO|nr:uncharacterized protein J8A68_000954 [[Candida] subhashii]KAG7665552.1 hypothetical protein J8A68_000954 [[Candida] subhashii]
MTAAADSSFNKDLLMPCPILKPNESEFADPIGYLARKDVAELAAKYGILKIVPPKDWKPPRSLSPNFKFHVRKQDLNDLGLVNRSRKFFQDNINRFWKMRRKKQLPLYFTVDGNSEKIYYYDLYIDVKNRGGWRNITRADWSEINHKYHQPSYATDIENEYEKNILYYEKYLTSHFGDTGEFPESDSEDERDNCLICNKNDHPDQTLLCDHCDNPFHTYCLKVPLQSIPSGKWYCDKCLIGTGEYGFDEDLDHDYDLPEFYQKCLEFDTNFATEYNNGNPLTVDLIEEKFWSFVTSENSNIQVLYGADIHNLKPGEISGFPMKNTPNLDLKSSLNQYYINHPWNLTRLPFAKGSLLNYINTAISGMTIPWIYIGSLLSTFCWHVEDHYTLSANYCHFGATKKWYGIPSSHADKFETLMKTISPDLFKKQPDLLHQITTLLSPMRIVGDGIPCTYADQNPGEFIVTYPRVYHAGFNCGFNFNEAVNFTMDDWLPFGEMAIEEYKITKKPNVFSHYELLENIMKRFNRQTGLISKSTIDLVQRSLKQYEGFIDKQRSLLFRINKTSFSLEYKPVIERILTEEEKLYGVNEEYEEDDKLCDGCKTHLCYQYCVIGNGNQNDSSSQKPSEQLPTPSSNLSPSASGNVDEIKPEEEDKKEVIHIHDDDDSATCMMDEFDKVINEAKKRATSEEPNEESNKRRRSSRRRSSSHKPIYSIDYLSAATKVKKAPSSPVGHKMNTRGSGGRMMMKSKPKQEKKPTQIRLCLECVVKKYDDDDYENVPPNSKLIYEKHLNNLEAFILETKRSLEKVG